MNTYLRTLPIFCMITLPLATYAQCDASTVASSTGEDILYTCPGDGIPNELEFQHKTFSPANYAYILADENDEIVEVLGFNTIDMDDLPIGSYRLYGLSYTEDLLATPGMNMQDGLAGGCTVISDGHVTIQNDVPHGGNITTGEGSTEITVPTGGDPALVDLAHNTNSIANSAFVVTDENNILQEVVNGDTHDFSQMQGTVAHVYAVSHTGDLEFQQGTALQDAMFSGDCFEVSEDHVTVTGISVAIFEAPDRRVLSLFPTVTDGIITILNDGSISPGDRITIVDPMGRQVQEAVWQGGERLDLDMALLPAGQYFCRVQMNNGIATDRFHRK